MLGQKVLLIFLCGCLIFGVIAVYKLTLAEYIKKRTHEYHIPEGLVNNVEYQALIQDWRELSKLNSWTSEHKMADDKYKFRFRKFLRSDLDKSKFIEIPIVAVRLQTAIILAENHYNSTGNLDWRKAITDRGYTLGLYVRSSGDFPADVVAVIEQIEEAYDLLDKEGQEVSIQKLYEVEDEIKEMTR